MILNSVTGQLVETQLAERQVAEGQLAERTVGRTDSLPNVKLTCPDEG